MTRTTGRVLRLLTLLQGRRVWTSTELSERLRVGREHAWPATKRSLRAVATSIGIELVTGVLIAATWFVTVLTT